MNFNLQNICRLFLTCWFLLFKFLGLFSCNLLFYIGKLILAFCIYFDLMVVLKVSEMEEVKKTEKHLTSAVAFVEGGIQEACDDACSICLEAFSETDPSTVNCLCVLLLGLL